MQPEKIDEPTTADSRPTFNDVDAKIYQASELTEFGPPERHFNIKRWFTIITALLLVFSISGMLGYKNIQANQLMDTAVADNQALKFDEAHSLLEEADNLWVLPSTRQEIKDNLTKTEQWQSDQKKFTQATTLINSGKYIAAIDLLKSVNDDYPDINNIHASSVRANNLLQQAYRGGGPAIVSTTTDTNTDTTLPTAGVTPQPTITTDTTGTTSPTSTHSTSTSMPTPTTSSAPKPSSTPQPSPTPQPSSSPAPSYIVTNSLCRVDATQAPDLYQVAKNFAAVCLTVFPQIEQRLSASPFGPLHNITFTNSGIPSGAAAITSFPTGNITVSIDYMRGNPTDLGLIVHELTHAVQAYMTNPPGWIIEGMADYMRYTLGYSTSWSYFHCNSNERYTAGYDCGAALLRYIERVYMPTVVKDLHNKIRANQYTGVFFSGNTGKSIDQLYAECRSAECSGGQP